MSPEANDAVWAELMNVTGGDPARAAVVRSSLRRLARSSTKNVLKEMAKEVLSGRIGFREAALSEAYGPAFTEGFHTFWSRYEQISESDRHEITAKGNAVLAKLRKQVSSEG